MPLNKVVLILKWPIVVAMQRFMARVSWWAIPIIPVATSQTMVDVESHIRKLEQALLLALKIFI